MDKVHAQKNSFAAPVRYPGHNRNICLGTLPSATCLGICFGCTPISLTGCGKVASPGTWPVVPVPRGPPGYLTGRDAGYRIPWVNHGATIFWHTDRMPDDDRFFPPRPAPERIELAAIKTDLEFAIGQLSRLHKQLARTALGIISARLRSPRF